MICEEIFSRRKDNRDWRCHNQNEYSVCIDNMFKTSFVVSDSNIRTYPSKYFIVMTILTLYLNYENDS